MTRSAVRSLRTRGGLGLALGALAAGIAVAGAQASDEPELTLSDMTYVGSEGGANDLLLTAERARYEPSEHVVYLEDIHMTAKGEDGSRSLDLTSEQARLWLDSNDFRAEGNVVGHVGDGRRFRTTWVHYERGPGVVSTDAPVTIDDPSGMLRGGGFRYDVRKQNLRLVGGASVVQP